MNKKILSIILIIVLSISVPLAFCLSSSASGVVSSLDMYDLYKGEAVQYRLSNPVFEVYNQQTHSVELHFEAGQGEAQGLGFEFVTIQQDPAIGETYEDFADVLLSVGDTDLLRYSASNDIYYRFTFDVRVLWSPSELRNKYNLDLLVYTDVGGCILTRSDTFSYVQFLDGETVKGENDDFYYTNLQENAYLPSRSSFNMRLYRVAPNRLRFTITMRLELGVPKEYRILGIQLAINSQEAEFSYIPKFNLDEYDDIYASESVLFNRVNGSVTQYFGDIYSNGLTKNSVARYGLAGVTLIFNNFILSNSYIMYIIYFGMAIGSIPFILLISRTIVTNSRKKE